MTKHHCRWCGDPLPLRFTTYCPGVDCLLEAHKHARTVEELVAIENLYRKRLSKTPALRPSCERCDKPRRWQSRFCDTHWLEHKRAYDRKYAAARRARKSRRCIFCARPLERKKKIVCNKHSAWRKNTIKRAWEARQREQRAAA